jgi:hypothetical protein
MNGGHRPVVTGIEGPNHVQCFGAANLSNDNAIRSETKGRTQQRSERNGSPSFRIGRTRLQTDNVTAECELGSILDGHNSLADRNLRPKKVEESGFARPCPAADDQVASLFDKLS